MFCGFLKICFPIGMPFHFRILCIFIGINLLRIDLHGIKMKNLLKKTLIFFAFISLLTASFGQSNDAVQVETFSLDEEKNVVSISIKTTESFIVGANRYVLHIGGKHFLRNEHPEGRLDEIVFYISLDEYETLVDQGRIVLVYGYYHENTQQDGEGSQANGFTGKHWDLGLFTPQKFKTK